MATTKRRTTSTAKKAARRAVSRAKTAGARATKKARGTASKAAQPTGSSTRRATKKATRTTRRATRAATRKTGARTTKRQTTTRSTTKRRSTSGSRDAVAVLKTDHKTVKDLFRRYKGLGDRAAKARRQTMERVVKELSVHAAVEEQVFYPDVRRSVPGAERLVEHGLEEHQELKETLARLQHLSPESPEFDVTMRQVIKDVTDHVKDEEGELFPKVRKAKSKQELVDMAELLRAAKRAAPTRPHPLAPSTPPGNILVGAASALVDTARDAVRGLGRGG